MSQRNDGKHRGPVDGRHTRAQERRAIEQRAKAQQRLGHVTLARLAAVRGVKPDSLRQRIHRGTLQAIKVGNTWLVPEAEARRVAGEPGQPLTTPLADWPEP